MKITRTTDGGATERRAGLVPSMDAQADYWRSWNQAARESAVPESQRRQGDIATAWLRALQRSDLRILEVGCGSGWLCERLTAFGRVTGLDLSAEMLARAQARVPDAQFVAGSIAEIDFPHGAFDVIVSLEVLAHVEDQQRFFFRCAHFLKAGGLLILSTQNRPVYERIAEIPPASPNQIRQWVDARQLRQLSRPHFEIRDLSSILPRGHGGYLRFINSVKLNRVISKIVGTGRVERVKERLGFGCTLMLLAERRAP